jgi:hypothetical protein
MTKFAMAAVALVGIAVGMAPTQADAAVYCAPAVPVVPVAPTYVPVAPAYLPVAPAVRYVAPRARYHDRVIVGPAHRFHETRAWHRR